MRVNLVPILLCPALCPGPLRTKLGFFPPLASAGVTQCHEQEEGRGERRVGLKMSRLRVSESVKERQPGEEKTQGL